MYQKERFLRLKTDFRDSKMSTVLVLLNHFMYIKLSLNILFFMISFFNKNFFPCIFIQTIFETEKNKWTLPQNFFLKQNRNNSASLHHQNDDKEKLIGKIKISREWYPPPLLAINFKFPLDLVKRTKNHFNQFST